MGDPAPDLSELVRGELIQPAPTAATTLADEILRRHGRAVAAVLFYGSCLRKRTSEGVLDFYVLVDAYRDAYRSRTLAWVNAALPPNVFYLEIESESGVLRCKYAVVSMSDFERGARPGGFRSGIWARFCQPALAVHLRDANARERVVAAVAESVVTAVARTVYQLPSLDGWVRFKTDALWRRILGETYSLELRPEAPDAVRNLYEADPKRYDRAARAALAQIGAELREAEDEIEVRLPAAAKPAAPSGWRRPRAFVKAVYFVQLLKSAATFGDWLPYALWKLERHTGTKIVPSERQRRYPFIFGWPILVRLLWRRDLR